tara:strand:+ start:3317 stop:4297 length:981 start_codon:yes stop_codon:yes gene_type:complete
MSEELNYYAKEEISNSDLGELKISPRRFVMRKQQQMQTKSAAMELGTLIHKFTLEPDTFIVADVEPVTGKMGEYIQAYFELEKSGLKKEQVATMAYAHAKYKASSSKPETILKSFNSKEENVAYYEFLKKADGKIALGHKDKQVIEGCLTSLKAHVVSNKLLFGTEETTETFNEKEIYFTQHGVKCKSKLDRLIVDHKTKTVTVVDLKTTSNQVYGECTELKTKTGILLRDWHVTGFMYSCLQYAYYRQLAFYMNAAMAEYPEYTVEGYIVAVDTKGSYDVAVYKLPTQWIEQGRTEIETLLGELKHYKESNNFNVKQGFEEAVVY